LTFDFLILKINEFIFVRVFTENVNLRTSGW